MRWMWRWNLQEDNLLKANEALRLIQWHLEQPGVLTFVLVGEPIRT